MKNNLFFENKWDFFKKNLPHQSGEMAKRNWGNNLHSLCSYQGKLKPSIANQLVSIFVPDGGSVLDVFSGVGTIPLEAGLQSKKSYAFDISPSAVIISKAKLKISSKEKIYKVVDDLNNFILSEKLSKKELTDAENFGFNKTLKEYFHPKTLEEIVLSRKFFQINGCDTPEKSVVCSCVMHILHGNRPYALSRRSHGMTPYAPAGEFEYKNLIIKLKEKVERTIKYYYKLNNFVEGDVFFQDSTEEWPKNIKDLDAIITSPPFFDSTRFYLVNWMRIWFAGWNNNDFLIQPELFVDEKQKKDFAIYEPIFSQAKNRLKKNGVFVLHLGKSKKCDMGKELSLLAEKWFSVYDLFEENVSSIEKHGIRDKGTVSVHQYLILINNKK